MSLSKKIFIFSSVVFLTTFFLWGIYRLAFKKNEPLVVDESKNSSSSQKEEKQDLTKVISKSNQKIIPITQEKVLAPTLSNSNNNSIIYYSQNGQVFEIDLEGNNKKTLSEKEIFGIKNVSWSPDKSKVLVEYEPGKTPSLFSFFDYSQKKGAFLNQSVLNVFWQNNNKIIYTYSDSKNSNLSSSNPDGSDWKKLTDLNYAGQIISSVPNSGLISFWNNPDANYETNLFTLMTLNGEKKIIFKGKFGADYLWNQEGNRVLISHSNEKNGHRIELAVAKSNGEKYKNLGIPTFVSKCLWSKDGKTVFYALPGDLPNNALLPNDYNSGKIQTTDTFWKVNTETGEKKRLVELNEIEVQVDAENLFFNADESMLFFINRRDGLLYRISL